MKILFLTFLTCAFHSMAAAKYVPKPFYMDANAVVEIINYDPVANTFTVANLQFYGQGPLFVTPEELVKSIPTLNLKRVARDPKAILTQQFKTDRKMKILPRELKEARRRPASEMELPNSTRPRSR